MAPRSPVAAPTASRSVRSFMASSPSMPLVTRSAKLGPVGPAAPVGPWVAKAEGPDTAPGGLPAAGLSPAGPPSPATDSIPETLMSSSDLQRGGVGVLRVLGGGDRGLEAALGHDQRAHLVAHLHVGEAYVALGVGQRVVRLVGEPALGAAELDAGDVDATVG